jgi:hypothetical protein
MIINTEGVLPVMRMVFCIIYRYYLAFQKKTLRNKHLDLILLNASKGSLFSIDDIL